MAESIHYNGRLEACCIAQQEFTLELVDVTLRAYPPALPEPPARRLAMQLLDHVLHEEPAPSKPARQAFHHHRVGIAPCGFTVAHTGDQGNVNEHDWLDRAHEHYRVDLLLLNSWAPDLLGLVAAYDPSFIVPGHENELGRDISHREPYWLSYVRMTTNAEKLR